jgi:predicted adenine nucleotide alpha hydrolase (AANH) superfamily ATPase
LLDLSIQSKTSFVTTLFEKMKILLHVCCALCTPYPLRILSEQGHQVSGFWYNPNIHPFTEYQNRLNAVKAFESEKRFPVLYNDSYDLEKYLKAVMNDMENRCSFCYKIRLIKTANWAIQEGFDAFTTTLLVSPYQKHELIREIGERIGKDLSIDFICRDFRPGFYEGKNEAKKLGLYSQKYCGCIFSEKERYLKKNKVESTEKSRV